MRRFFLLVSFILSAFASGLAQNPQTGLYEFGPYDSPGFDTINRGNLNVHLSIPIFSKSGRAGSNFGLALNYDSLVWAPASSSGLSTWSPAANWGWTTVSNAEFGYVTYEIDTRSCLLHGIEEVDFIYSQFVYHDRTNHAHAFSFGFTTACGGSGFPPGTATYAVTDNSGYTIYRNGSNFTAFTKTGEQYAVQAVPQFNGLPTNPVSGVGTYTDTNGNQISASSSGVFTDTLGTTALTVTGAGTPASPVLYTYTDPTGASQSVKVNYSASTVTTNFGLSGTTEYSEANIPLVSSIVYPDGSQYSFTYEQTPGSSSTFTGRLASVTLTSGGKISYVYTGGYNGIETDGSTSGLKRTTSDGTTSYVRSGLTTTYTDASTSANTTVSSFLEDPQGYIYETSRSIYAGTASGTPLQQVTTCYAQVANCPANSVTAPIGYVTTTLAQNGVTVRTDAQQYSGGFLTNDNDGIVNETTAYQPFTGANSITFERVSSVTDVMTSSQTSGQIAQIVIFMIKVRLLDSAEARSLYRKRRCEAT
jgi:hypothetical protein